jgi:hypothetical protein
MNNFQKFKESVFAVSPISLTVLILGIAVCGFDTYTSIGLIVGSVLLILGITLFSIGVDVSIMSIGENLSGTISKTGKVWLMLLTAFFIGILVSIPEPGLAIIAGNLSASMPKGNIDKWVLIIVVGVGVGAALSAGVIKTVLKIELNKLLLILWSVVFVIALILTLTGKVDFIPAAFDNGGAVTGAITVPFIMAFGVGVALMRKSENASDNFGFTALAVVGPVLAVLLWGLFATTPKEFTDDTSTFHMADYWVSFPGQLADVAIPVFAIIAFFLIYQITLIKMPLKSLMKIFSGAILTIIGVAIFLTGANMGFSPIGGLLGTELVAKGLSWLLIPVGVIVGCFIVLAEPAIVVLNAQVEKISGGTIKKKTMLVALMIAIGVAIGLSMTRVMTGLNIWWIVFPGYSIAILFSFFVPKVFTAIAFDSGAVASGPITCAFVLPFALSTSAALGGNPLTDAFGAIALVALMPLIAVQVVGLIVTVRQKNNSM